MKENLYIVWLDFRDGENEYTKPIFARAKSKTEAKDKTHEYLKDYFGEETKITEDKYDIAGHTDTTTYYESPKGYPILSAEYIKKVETVEDIVEDIGEIEVFDDDGENL